MIRILKAELNSDHDPEIAYDEMASWSQQIAYNMGYQELAL